jgi:hypothetical protein
MPLPDAEQVDVDVVAVSPLPTSLPGLVSVGPSFRES